MPVSPVSRKGSGISRSEITGALTTRSATSTGDGTLTQAPSTPMTRYDSSIMRWRPE